MIIYFILYTLSVKFIKNRRFKLVFIASREDIYLRYTDKGVLLALLAMVFAGGFMIPWKMAVQHGSAASMVAILVLTAALANTALLAVQKGFSRLFKWPNKTELALGIFFALLTLWGNWASAKSIVYLPPAMVSLFMRSEVVFITLLAWTMLGEKAGLNFWLGCILVGFGLWIMQPPTTLAEGWLRGMGFAILAAAVFALMAVFTRKYIVVIDTMVVNSIRLWLAVVIWIPFGEGVTGITELSPELFLYVGLAALLGPVVGRVTFMNSSQYLEARLSALIVSGAPVCTLVLGIIFLNDWPESRQLTGGAMMLGGILIILLRSSKTPRLRPVPKI